MLLNSFFTQYALLVFLSRTTAESLKSGGYIPAELQALPACSHSCLSQYISNAFGSRVCGNTPSLGCLCTYGNAGQALGNAFAACFYPDCRSQQIPSLYPLLDLCSGQVDPAVAGPLLAVAEPTGVDASAESITASLESNIPVKTTLGQKPAIMSTINPKPLPITTPHLSESSTARKSTRSSHATSSTLSLRSTNVPFNSETREHPSSPWPTSTKRSSSSPVASHSSAAIISRVNVSTLTPGALPVNTPATAASTPSTTSSSTQIAEQGNSHYMIPATTSLIAIAALVGFFVICVVIGCIVASLRKRPQRRDPDSPNVLRKKNRGRLEPRNDNNDDEESYITNPRYSVAAYDKPKHAQPFHPTPWTFEAADVPRDSQIGVAVSPNSNLTVSPTNSDTRLLSGAPLNNFRAPEDYSYTPQATGPNQRVIGLRPVRNKDVSSGYLEDHRALVTPADRPDLPVQSRSILPRPGIPAAHSAPSVMQAQKPLWPVQDPSRSSHTRFAVDPNGSPRNGGVGVRRTTRDYLPSYYLNHSHPPAPSSHRVRVVGDQAISEQTSSQVQKAKPAQRAARFSNSSDTSFETTFDEEDATPPEVEDRRLEPVLESPARVVYPKVPRSSNQSVSRSYTPIHQNGSDSSLLEKRRGNGVARDLSKNLWITHSNTGAAHSNGDHAGSSRNAGHKYNAPDRPQLSHQSEMTIRCPLWEPNFSPKRKPGGDLTIQFS